MRTRLVGLSFLLVSFAQAQYPGAKEVPAPWRTGFRSIDEQTARAILPTLAGPEFNGRAPEAEYPKAAQWCADWLKSNGLVPAGENGTYFQWFTLQNAKVANALLRTADLRTSLVLGSDFTVSSAVDWDSRIRLAFLRVPKGGTMPALDIDSMEDTVIVVHPDTREAAADALRELQILAGENQKGVVVLTPSAGGGNQTAPTVLVAKEAPPQRSVRFPTPRLTVGSSLNLARALGADNYAAAETTRSSFEVGTQRLDWKGTVTREDVLRTMNVVAKIEGAHPGLKREAVVIGSHLDHVGVNARGTHWGADDNASGVTANMMAARAFARNGRKPDRTVIFALWSCEEKGLWGSWVYANNPVIPLDKTVAYLNMDMVGRDSMDARWNDKPENNTDAIYAASAKTFSPDLYRVIHDANKFVGLRLRDDREDTTFRSDTASFAKFKIPILKAFTGEHVDYHKPTDTPDKINFVKLANVSRWIYCTAQALANSISRPKFVEQGKLLMCRATLEGAPTLTPDAVLEASLVDISNPMRETVLDTTVVTKPGQLPIRFALSYDGAAIKPQGRYQVRVSIRDGGRMILIAPGFPVLQQPRQRGIVDVVLSPRED